MWQVLTDFPEHVSQIVIYRTGCGGRIGGALASHAEGREFQSRSSHTNDLQNLWLSLPSMVIGVTRKVNDWVAHYQDKASSPFMRLR